MGSLLIPCLLFRAQRRSRFLFSVPELITGLFRCRRFLFCVSSEENRAFLRKSLSVKAAKGASGRVPPLPFPVP